MAIKNKIQFKFLECAARTAWIVDPINRAISYFGADCGTQYKHFINTSYIENSDCKRLLSENRRLKKIIKYLNENDLINGKYVTSDIMYGVGNTYGFIKLGTKHGIKNNQAVVNEFGLVGKTIEVNESHAKIIFLTDVNCRIIATTAESNYKIITSGGNGKYLDALYLLDNAQLKVGEMVITTGELNFTSGVKVGIVDENGKIIPIVDFNKLSSITIMIE